MVPRLKKKVNRRSGVREVKKPPPGKGSRSRSTKPARTKRTTKPSVLAIAQSYVKAGLSPIPIRADGSKAPETDLLPLGEDGKPTWKPLQEKRPLQRDLQARFGAGDALGIGIICGKVSKNLEVIDIDDTNLIGPWKKKVEELAPGLLARLPQVRTPNGRHVYYRCRKIEGSQKLAERSADDPLYEKQATLIEMRGEGAYVVAPGSHLDCHETGKPYKEVVGPSLTEIPTITVEEREALLTATRMLNRKVEVITGNGAQAQLGAGNRPGDDYNQTASWDEILESHGWKKVSQSGKTTFWRRPGKKTGISATTGHCSNGLSGDLLYIFSSNANPFEAGRAYSKFAAYALLNHEGDFRAAAKDLHKQGYGKARSHRRNKGNGEESVQSESESSAPYYASSDGIFWQKETKHGFVDVQLTNFNAQIIGDVLHDDGVEKRRQLEIEANPNGLKTRFTVPGEQFTSMNWVSEHLGPKAIVFAGFGARDNARCAIQMLSDEIVRRTVYTHTGWRRLDESQWVYLQAGGGIGRDGRVSTVEVELPDALSRFVLPDPPANKRDLQRAIRTSLKLLDLVPDRIGFPLYSAICRAVLAPCDFSVHLTGETGVGKTELAALAQQHWGAELGARNLPGSWSSTGNALEGLAFAAKDTLLVVDDFAPQGTQYDMAGLNREADRLLRAQGNRSGRLRMRADASLRPAKYPRGLVLSTGEDVPRKQSVRARLLVLEVGPSDLDWDQLTECQDDAAEGLYAEVMAGFVKWLAGRYDKVQKQLRKDSASFRQKATSRNMHRRTASIVGDLLAGFRQFIDFAAHIGAISKTRKANLWERAWNAFTAVAAAQMQHQAASEPTQRFLSSLASAITSGQAHIAGPNGVHPEHPERWGWEKRDLLGWRERGARVGWTDGSDLYLEPNMAFTVVQRMGRDSGETLGVTLATLKRRLKEKGLLVSTDSKRETLTIRKSLEGRRREVLHFHVDSLFPPTPEPDQPDQGSSGSE